MLLIPLWIDSLDQGLGLDLVTSIPCKLSWPHFKSDVYQKRHPITPGFTWTHQHTQTAVRLDMFLVSSVLDHRISDVSVLPTAFSDHSGVLLTLRSSLAATKGVWSLEV